MASRKTVRLLLTLTVVLSSTLRSSNAADCYSRSTLNSCASNSFFINMGCYCYTCNQENGNITYACSSPSNLVCSGTQEEPNGELSWTTKDYSKIDLAYIGVCAAAYALICVIARLFPSQVAKKDATPACCDVFTRIRSSVYGFFIEPVLEDDGRTIRGFFEYIVTENEVLNTFRLRCYPKPKSADTLRPFLYRFSVLLVGILVSISIGQLFGSLEYDDQCSLTVNLSACPGQVNLTVDSSCQSFAVDTSFLSTTSIITTFLGQMISYITGKMRETFVARSSPDRWLHLFNVVFAAGLVGIAYWLSVKTSNGVAAAGARLQLMISITLFTYVQGQAYALVQIPLFYYMRTMFLSCFGGRSIEGPKASSPVNPQDKSKDSGGAVVFPHQVEMEHISADKTIN